LPTGSVTELDHRLGFVPLQVILKLNVCDQLFVDHIPDRYDLIEKIGIVEISHPFRIRSKTVVILRHKLGIEYHLATTHTFLQGHPKRLDQ